jgi:DNA-binding NarL/FixJ family response regulator
MYNFKTIDEGLDYFANCKKRGIHFKKLSNGQMQVALLMYAGLNYKKISKKLRIQVMSVKAHYTLIKDKLSLFNTKNSTGKIRHIDEITPIHIIKILHNNQVFPPDFLFSLVEV